ncbi:MAG: hypothetical protein ACK5NT_06095 [Pyrinomonadaceae bacterium]
MIRHKGFRGGNLTNGAIALLIVVAIALGCTCNDGKFKFGSKNENSNSSKSSKDGDGTSAESKDTSNELDSEDTVPSDERATEIATKTLLAFNSAVKSGDFTNFYNEQVSSFWKKQTTPQTFNEGFAEFITKNVDIGSIEGKEPTFSPPPKIVTRNGVKVLMLYGKYKTFPRPVNFQLEYIFDGDAWKLITIKVDTV